MLDTDSSLEPYGDINEINLVKSGIEKVAGVTRLELATSGVTGQRSNQLSYTPLGEKRLM